MGKSNACQSKEVDSGVCYKHPVILQRASIITVSTILLWMLGDHTVARYSAVLYTRARTLVCSVCVNVSQVNLVEPGKKAYRDAVFWHNDKRRF